MVAGPSAAASGGPGEEPYDGPTEADALWWREYCRDVPEGRQAGPTAADWAEYAAWSGSDLDRYLNALDSPDRSGGGGHDA